MTGDPGTLARPVEHGGAVLGDPLTPKELGVLKAIAAGLSTKEIATAKVRGVETIKQHRKRILWKLGARNAAHAVAIALRRGLIE